MKLLWTMIRGDWWEIAHTKIQSWGLTRYDKYRIEIDERVLGFQHLDTACHEWLHAAFPKMKESEVGQLGTELASYLDVLGYVRKSDADF